MTFALHDWFAFRNVTDFAAIAAACYGHFQPSCSFPGILMRQALSGK
jgi:hypothetical protein